MATLGNRMRIRVRLAMATLAFASSTSAASAADWWTPQAAPVDWSGFSFDVTIYRPTDSRVFVGVPIPGIAVGYFNSTGVQAVAAVSYLFQAPGSNFVFGPRLKVRGGIVEAMPQDFTIRDNVALTLGAEGGFAFGSWYLYGFGGGGAAWLSTYKPDLGNANSVVSAVEVGLGVRYRITDRWYAKVEGGHNILGDHRLGPFYFDPKAFHSIAAGFGLRY
jgi:hypothetical protein